MGARRTIANLVAQGVAIVGSPDTVRKRITAAHRELGFGTFMTLLQFGSLSAQLTNKNMHLFAKEVLPALQALTDKDYAGYEPKRIPAE